MSQTPGLVEPDGVNAESDLSEDARAGSSGDARSGGAPERATHQQPAHEEAGDILGAPDQDADSPGQELSAGEG